MSARLLPTIGPRYTPLRKLFRPCAIRAADPPPDDEHVNLDTGNGYQGSLAPNSHATTAVAKFMKRVMHKKH